MKYIKNMYRFSRMVGVFRNTLGNGVVKDEPQDKAGNEFLGADY